VRHCTVRSHLGPAIRKLIAGDADMAWGPAKGESYASVLSLARDMALTIN
jgi:hypothetical protein